MRLFLTIAAVVVCAGPLWAADESKPAAESVAPAKVELLRVEATNKEAIVAAKGKTVIVTGTITVTKEIQGLTFLNFGQQRDFVVVVAEKDYNKFSGGHPAELYKNKKIEVTGEIVDYKGKLEIKATAGDQIKIISDTVKPADKGDGTKSDGKGAATTKP